MPRSSWLAMKAAGTVTRISSACGRQNHALAPSESASFTSACSGQRPPARPVTWQACGAPPRADTSAAASCEIGEPDSGLSSAGAQGRWPILLAQQQGVAVWVEQLHLAAERVRRMSGTGDRHARPFQHADDGLDVVVEEVEQQRQSRDVHAAPVEAEQDRHPPCCMTDQAEASAVPEECSSEAEQPVEGAQNIDVADVGRATIDRARGIMSTPYAASTPAATSRGGPCSSYRRSLDQHLFGRDRMADTQLPSPPPLHLRRIGLRRPSRPGHQQRMPAFCGGASPEQHLKTQSTGPEPLSRPQVAARAWIRRWLDGRGFMVRSSPASGSGRRGRDRRGGLLFRLAGKR